MPLLSFFSFFFCFLRLATIDEAEEEVEDDDDNIGGGDIVTKGAEDMVRNWEDLSPEELREEQALMKIIQGQTIRLK